MIECESPSPRFDHSRGRDRWTASAPQRRYRGAVDAYRFKIFEYLLMLRKPMSLPFARPMVGNSEAKPFRS